jgi:hypothetical protein
MIAQNTVQRFAYFNETDDMNGSALLTDECFADRQPQPNPTLLIGSNLYDIDHEQDA